MSKSTATIVGGAAGAIALLAIIIGLVWFYKSQCRNVSNKNSDTGSSDPSALVEWNRGGEGSNSATRQQPTYGALREFTIEELGQATKQFSESCLMGYGSFGLVFKGLLRDTIVAIKRRQGPPRQEFVDEVRYLSEIRHSNLVSLLGYCQESGFQMLVFEYIPNGCISNHLYDARQDLSTKLEFKQRLFIALGAAKGLSYLHGLKPQLLHKNFKTANVLVDEHFIAKVADVGITKLLEKIEEAGPSRMPNVTVYHDPEVEDSVSFTELSDVYSFGVFLLELVTGQEASHIESLRSYDALIKWVRFRLSSNEFVDPRLAGKFTPDGMRDLIRLTLQCMSFPAEKRPKMETVTNEIERIHEDEMALTTVPAEGSAIITLGSELFA